MLLVLDTNIISELMKPEPVVLAWFLRHTQDQFATTEINQAEILGGLALLPEGKCKRGMIVAAKAIWDVELQQLVLPFDASCSDLFAHILRRRTGLGKPIQFADAAIAAICATHEAVIVTRDTGYVRIGRLRHSSRQPLGRSTLGLASPPTLCEVSKHLNRASLNKPPSKPRRQSPP